jgi:hypothetical protein
VSCQLHAPATFTPVKKPRFPLGPWATLYVVEKKELAPTWIWTTTIQPVASRYTDSQTLLYGVWNCDVAFRVGWTGSGGRFKTWRRQSLDNNEAHVFKWEDIVTWRQTAGIVKPCSAGQRLANNAFRSNEYPATNQGVAPELKTRFHHNDSVSVSVNKSNHPVRDPFLLVTEPYTWQYGRKRDFKDFYLNIGHCTGRGIQSSPLWRRVVRTWSKVSKESVAWFSGCKNKRRSACSLLLLVPCLAYFSTLKMEVMCTSETLDFLRCTRLYNADDQTLHSHCCKNRNSNIGIDFFRTEHNVTDKECFPKNYRK